MNNKAKIIVFDIECYYNFFCVVNYDVKKDTYVIFEISETNNQLAQMKKYYNSLSKKDYLVGFNSLDYDWPILDWILKQKKLKPNNIYKYSQKIIGADFKEKWKFRPKFNSIGQIDLYKIHNYGNQNKSCSLKYLQFTTRWKKMQDLPYYHGSDLTRAQELELIKYCINDVDSTKHFMDLSKNQLNLRFKLSKKYKKNLINYSEPKISSYILLDKYCTKTGKDPNKIRKLRTHRNEIILKDVILPYINFKTEEFKDVLKQFKNIILTSDNSEFKIKKEFRGISYDFGKGGIHASDIGSFEKSSNELVKDYDVTSYYPNLSIKNKFYPKHLGEEFCEAYEELFEERKLYPKSTHFAENYIIKIALNSAYGNSNSEHSFLFDFLLTLKITINGQLSLLMLIERVLLLDKSIKCVAANTDGVVFKFPKSYLPKIEHLCKKWEEVTKLNLEDASYSKVFARDVNHYIAVYSNKNGKFKGAYEIDKDFHKDNSQRVVKLAVANYVINKISVRESVKNHLLGGDYIFGEETYKNYGIFDFCIGKKASVSNYTLITEGEQNIEIKDKVLRFYVANTRKKLLKNYTKGKKAGSFQAIVKGWNIEMFMDYVKKENYNINYEYYIQEANKLITPIEKPSNKIKTEQLTLF